MLAAVMGSIEILGGFEQFVAPVGGDFAHTEPESIHVGFCHWLKVARQFKIFAQ
jgi:hypothetical protein